MLGVLIFPVGNRAAVPPVPPNSWAVSHGKSGQNLKNAATGSLEPMGGS